MTNIQDYATRQAERLRTMGRARTCEIYTMAARRFAAFCGEACPTFGQIDTSLIEAYEAHLLQAGLCRNTSSFYLRALRRLYNLATDEGLATQRNPFRTVYTGIDRTPKRAITQTDIARICRIELPPASSLDYARDMFMLSFCLRGMAFVDMAYLRKSDLRNGYITYCRRKTRRQLCIRWEKPMQHILDKYATNPTQYLLPIIQREDGRERRQYLNRLLCVNRQLKHLGKRVGLTLPLSMYVARHSWASIAQQRDVPLAIISSAMGHESELTTQIYLSQIVGSRIDEVNLGILQDL